MKLTVYLKPDNKIKLMHYQLDLGEYQRLAADYQHYLNTGEPAIGVYQMYPHWPEGVKVKGPAVNQTSPVTLQFKQISAIV